MELTPEFFDTLTIVVIIIGLALALVRLYRELSRPAPPFGAAPSDDLRMMPPQDSAQGRTEK